MKAAKWLSASGSGAALGRRAELPKPGSEIQKSKKKRKGGFLGKFTKRTYAVR